MGSVSQGIQVRRAPKVDGIIAALCVKVLIPLKGALKNS